MGLGGLQLTVLVILGLFAFGLDVWALVNAARHRPDAYRAAGKLSKQAWIAILALATAIGFISLPFPGVVPGGPLNFLNLLAVVASAVFIVDTKPKLQQASGRGGGGTNWGPYGPW